MIGAVGTWAPGRRWARRRSRTPRQTGTPSPTAPLTPAGRRGPTSRGGRRVPGRCLGAPGCYRAPTVGASLRTTALSPTRCSGGPGSRDLLSSRVRCSRRGVGPGAVRDASRPPPSARAHRSSPASHLTRLGRRLRVEGRGLPSPAQTSREGRPPGALREATRDPPWLETATQNAGPPFEAPQDIWTPSPPRPPFGALRTLSAPTPPRPQRRDLAPAQRRIGLEVPNWVSEEAKKSTKPTLMSGLIWNQRIWFGIGGSDGFVVSKMSTENVVVGMRHYDTKSFKSRTW